MTLTSMTPASIFLPLTVSGYHSQLTGFLEPTTLGMADRTLVRPALGTCDTESWGPAASPGACAADEAQT